eukprot:TRINITY_DN16336_c0_g2_i1.p1 TRINITY_DN16336_c0_g2~~TRINITY_DN16336_c0_g2_i1.p1  ORF type:complete len:409 (+),score=82.28 TRINITY_DN16336_c0_g2_i1:76-1302(+)
MARPRVWQYTLKGRTYVADAPVHPMDLKSLEGARDAVLAARGLRLLVKGSPRRHKAGAEAVGCGHPREEGAVDRPGLRCQRCHRILPAGSRGLRCAAPKAGNPNCRAWTCAGCAKRPPPSRAASHTAPEPGPPPAPGLVDRLLEPKSASSPSTSRSRHTDPQLTSHASPPASLRRVGLGPLVQFPSAHDPTTAPQDPPAGKSPARDSPDWQPQRSPHTPARSARSVSFSTGGYGGRPTTPASARAGTPMAAYDSGLPAGAVISDGSAAPQSYRSRRQDRVAEERRRHVERTAFDGRALLAQPARAGPAARNGGALLAHPDGAHRSTPIAGDLAADAPRGLLPLEGVALTPLPADAPAPPGGPGRWRARSAAAAALAEPTQRFPAASPPAPEPVARFRTPVNTGRGTSR